MRLHDWDVRLMTTVQAYRARPFVWGASDCLAFACACAEAITGNDEYAPYRGTYDDAAGAYRVILALGARDAPGALETKFAPIAIAMAQRGDLAVIVEPGGDDPLGATGVVVGAQVAGYGATGLHFVPLDQCTRAFRVD